MEPVIDTPTEEELKLAEELRGTCNVYGEERWESLVQSAEVLTKMGQLYVQKARDSTGRLQKLCFIRACALLNGAKVRFHMKEAKEQHEKVHVLLEHMSNEALQASIIGDQDASLMDISADIKRRIIEMRERTSELLASVRQTSSDDSSQTDAERMETTKIRDVMDEISHTYTEIMQRIATNCEEILGEPPCRFALVGLGSLARREITPYSDFEHVIALEDSVRLHTCYDDIKEYFRWFATLFQLIIIGLGETFIRSVGVKSINDYSGPRNWYFDIHTPCGIAFDGMVPHSCNNPLGKLESSKIRYHAVELIQPCSLMAKYLTYTEDVKNGYILADILTRTCLVYGSDDVYRDFSRRCALIRDTERREHDVITKNLLHLLPTTHMSAQLDQGLTQKTDAKKALYRPVTACLAYIAHFYDVRAPATFDIIRALEERGMISDVTARQLELGVAIACEVRLRIYNKAGNQRHWLWRENIIELVGKSCAVDCLCYARCIESATYNTFLNWKPGADHTRLFENEFKKVVFMGRVEALQKLGCLDEAEILGERYKDQDEVDLHQHLRLTKVYKLQSVAKPELREEYLRKAEELMKSIQAASTDPQFEGLVDSYLGDVYHEQGRPQLSEDAFRRSIFKTDDPSQFPEPDKATITVSNPTRLTNLPLLMPRPHQDPIIKYTRSLHQAIIYNAQNNPEKASETLRAMRDDMVSRHVDVFICMEFGVQMLKFQLRKKWLKDALATLDLFTDANEGKAMKQYERLLNKFVGLKISILCRLSASASPADDKPTLLRAAIAECERALSSHPRAPSRDEKSDSENTAILWAHLRKLVNDSWRRINKKSNSTHDEKEPVVLCTLLFHALGLRMDSRIMDDTVTTSEILPENICDEHSWLFSNDIMFFDMTHYSPCGSQ